MNSTRLGHIIAVAHPVKGIDAGCHIGYLTKDTERNCEIENGPCPLGPGHDRRSSEVPPNAIHRCGTPDFTRVSQPALPEYRKEPITSGWETDRSL